jgi:hypothetical protein
LDYNEWLFSFEQCFTLPGYYSDFEVISTDPDKLVFFVKNTFECHCYSGKLANSQIEMTGTFLMQHYVKFINSAVAEEDKLIVLDSNNNGSMVMSNRDGFQINAEELKFVDGTVQHAKTVEFKIENPDCWRSVSEVCF